MNTTRTRLKEIEQQLNQEYPGIGLELIHKGKGLQLKFETMPEDPEPVASRVALLMQYGQEPTPWLLRTKTKLYMLAFLLVMFLVTVRFWL